jgi:hypothetical protein
MISGLLFEDLTLTAGRESRNKFWFAIPHSLRG